MYRLTLTLLILALTLVPANAASVLVWSTGNSGTNTAAIAVWLQASGKFTSVTGVDSNSQTLLQLLAYDKVLYFSNSDGGQDPAAIGDVLDGYAASGRRLVLGTFAFASQGGNTLGGGIISNGTSPYLVNGSSLYSNATMQSNDGSAFFTGVNTLGGYYRDNVALTSGATARGDWSDGAILLATKGNVVGVNLFPDDGYGNLSGDYRQLFINALAEDAGGQVPEPATMALAGAGLLALTFIRARKG